MPRPHPPEFRQRAVVFARLGDKPVSETAGDLGISDSCLRGWLKQADIDGGRRGGVSSAEHDELVSLRRKTRTLRLENRDLEAGRRLFCSGERSPNMTYTFIAERCPDLPVAPAAE